MKQLYRFLFFVNIILQFFCENQLSANDIIKVNKGNVIHCFVSSDPQTDYFIKNIFENWEPETFNLFEQVRDKNSVAINIGAWVGTNAIWLSKNFKHVITVEPDIESFKCLKNNLNSSDCSNITLVTQPVMDITKKVIFGPQGNKLNESTSCVKKKSDNFQDYTVKSITFKQLIHDYVYDNETLKNSKISFITCDIEGGEEHILEDVLHFAYNNDCKVFMSFHVDKWKDKNIDEFAYLFKYFRSNCPEENVVEFIKKNPLASLLFEPMENGVLFKKNISIVIIGYNQYTYIKNMVEQVEKFTNDIIIVDNQSSYQPLLDYYKNDFKYTVLKKNYNYGYIVYHQKFVQDLVGDIYIITDPDLKFNPKLPSNFLNDFIEISNHFEANRVGFALLIDTDDIREDTTCYGQSIQIWEKRFWLNKVIYPKNPNLELYHASLDTTFCLVNRRFKNEHIRVAGDYTCIHIPWHKNFKQQLQEGEYEYYVRGNNSSNWNEK